ncbi:hypothetical protein RR47_GL000808 [Enterococcus columbae DSM 7374 = ATCC 51263]|nr:hypothetical protein RR47_GL000808 [Enterococcus columbae DSM 7374 = ATCC 51263]
MVDKNGSDFMERKQKINKISWVIKHWRLTIFGVLLAFIVVSLVSIGVYKQITSQSTSVGLKDIGELSTQSAIVREVNMIDESRTIFGMQVPFTNSKQLYSYEVEIKAGYDFSKIRLERNTASKRLTVILPKLSITSKSLVDGSLKVYYDKQSIFKPINVEETEEARQKMIHAAIKTAKKTKLFENARQNAERLITEFLKRDQANKDYEIIFK